MVHYDETNKITKYEYKLKPDTQILGIVELTYLTFSH